MKKPVANDVGAVSLTDAEVLIKEIDRLNAQVAKLEAQVAELDEFAHKDSLSNLPNRRRFLARLERLVARVELSGEPAAIIFVDVDGLKTINDKFGHKAGDEALVEIGRLLAATVRGTDCVARLGGDEFGIILERTDELSAWQTALRVVENVMDCQFCVDGSCVPLSVAVGVGPIRPGDSCQLAMDRADKQMYRLKRHSPPLSSSAIWRGF